MLGVKSDIKSLISNIYECQKKIIFYRRIVRESGFEGDKTDIPKIVKEIELLEAKIKELKKELQDKYDR